MAKIMLKNLDISDIIPIFALMTLMFNLIKYLI